MLFVYLDLLPLHSLLIFRFLLLRFIIYIILFYFTQALLQKYCIAWATTLHTKHGASFIKCAYAQI